MDTVKKSLLAPIYNLCKYRKIKGPKKDSVVEIPAIRRRRKSREHDLKLAMLNLRRGIPEKIIKEGSLLVQSKGLWRLPASFWKERYFILNNDCLYFYKRGKNGEAPQSPKEIIFLDDDIGIYTEEIGAVNGNKNYCLKLTKRRRTYTLCACSEIERNSWLTALLTVVTENHMLRSSNDTVVPTIPEESVLSTKVGNSEWNLSDVQRESHSDDDDFWATRRASSAQIITSSTPDRNNNSHHGKLFKAFSMLNLSSHNEHRKKLCSICVKTTLWS